MANGTRSADSSPATPEPVDDSEAKARTAREQATREAARLVRVAVEAVTEVELEPGASIDPPSHRPPAKAKP